MLVTNGKREGREVRHNHLFCFSHFDHQSQIFELNITSATPSTYPTTLSSIFSSWRVHLDLQTLCVPFLFPGFFLWFSIKFYPYFFQGPRLNCWEPFFSTCTTCLPRLNSLDRLLSLFYSRKFKHGMIQIRLLDHPSKLSLYQDVDTPCLFMKIWDLCIIKAEHIWTFYSQSWNMKPIGIGNQQWLHMGMVFHLKDQEQQVRLP